MRNQIKRAKVRNDSQDLELTMDMMVVLSAENDRNADSASIERLANKLGLHTMEDLKAETIAVRKLVKERRGNNVEATQQIVDLLNKFKQFVGIEETNLFDDPAVMPKANEKFGSLAIPHEFLCPITLEIMQDPVILATGQVTSHSPNRELFRPVDGDNIKHICVLGSSSFMLQNWNEVIWIGIEVIYARYCSSSQTHRICYNKRLELNCMILK